MEISESKVNGVLVLALSGRLDGVAAPMVEQKVFSALTGGPEHVVFDCSGVEYASSAGLRVFLAAAKRLKTSGGRCGFAALTPGLRDIFSISGFLDVLEVHETLEAATA